MNAVRIQFFRFSALRFKPFSIKIANDSRWIGWKCAEKRSLDAYNRDELLIFDRYCLIIGGKTYRWMTVKNDYWFESLINQRDVCVCRPADTRSELQCEGIIICDARTTAHRLLWILQNGFRPGKCNSFTRFLFPFIRSYGRSYSVELWHSNSTSLMPRRIFLRTRQAERKMGKKLNGEWNNRF